MLPSFLLGFGFLGLLIGITTVLVSIARNSRDAPSQRALSGVLALLGLAGVGLAGFIGLVGAVGLFLATTFIEHGPVRSVEILRAGARPASYSDLGGIDDDYASGLEGEAAAAYDRYEGQVGTARPAVLDPRYPVHVLVEFEGDVLVGSLSLGLTQHVGVLRGLMQTKTPLGRWKERLMRDPHLIMEAYLERAQGQNVRAHPGTVG